MCLFCGLSLIPIACNTATKPQPPETGTIDIPEGATPAEVAHLGNSQRKSENAEHSSTKLPVESGLWTDGTAESGVQFTYRNGQEGKQFTILETVGGGVSLLDFDQDGLVDLFVPGGGSLSAAPPNAIKISGLPSGLFQNLRGGKFKDCSEKLKVTKPLYSHGGFVADYNRDGFPDILVTGYGGCQLLRNESGREFQDATSGSDLPQSGWFTAAAWGDVNRDGWPDVMLVGYVDWQAVADLLCGDPQRKIRDNCPPQKYAATRQRLFLNNQNGSFTEVEKAFEGPATGKGLGLLAADLNGDDWIDYYVANDQVANQLYLGGPRFPLREVAVSSGVAGSEYGVSEGSMGVDTGDFDGDGMPDLWVTNYELEDNSLYQNQGSDHFRHATVRAGLGGVGRAYVGFGTGFADFDLDGWLDLFVINGHVLYETGRSPYRQPPFLLHNEATKGGRRFRDVTKSEGSPWFRGQYPGRGAAVGDMDNDGDLDLVVSRINEPVSVLWNQSQPKRWLSVELVGTTSDPNTIGASLRYRYEGREIVRHVRSGAGYLSQFDQRILLPASEAAAVTVHWITGKTEQFRNLKWNETNSLREGMGEPQ